MTGASFSQRFIALTIIGYVTAVGAAALAVWFESKPVLSEWQQRTIQENAEANVQAARVALRELGLKTLLLAQNPDIEKVTIGDEANLDRARDQLQSFKALEGLINVYLFDFSGEVVLYQRIDATQPPQFMKVDHITIARKILAGNVDEFRFSYRPGRDPAKHNFMVALPVRVNGFVEGVLAAEVAVDASDTVTHTSTIGTVRFSTDFQREITEAASPNSVAVPVPGTNFHVVLDPDASLAKTAGEDLVDRVLYAVGFSLLIPFCLMTFAGHRSIVAPHKALEASQSALRQNQKKLTELADIAQRSNDAIITTDLEGSITWVNAAFSQITGFSQSDVIGRKPGDILQGQDTDHETRTRISQALSSRRPIRTEILNYFKDGTPYWNAVSIAPQYDENGSAYGFVAISSDITEKRKAHEKILKAKSQIEHQANHDPLTGLPNRRALDAELDRLKHDNKKRVLVRIDLDHFKNVNDTLGHAAGDHVLCVVSDLLLSHIRKGDLAARVGGDEFVILMAHATETSEAVALADRLLVEFQKEIAFGDKTCRIGASFGVATTGDGLLQNCDILLGADSALYEAKAAGRNCVVCYSKELHANVVANRHIAKEIELGIANGEFEPYFQPQFDAKSFEFTGVEALARWRHPSRGVLAPHDFLCIAEQLSVAADMDAIIFEKGLNSVLSLNNSGFRIPKISFNVVASRLEEPDLPEVVHQLAFEGTKVCFEVLESVLVEEQSDLFQARVDLLRDIGFGIEVDDFGSGHASIIGLTELSPDTMKIDQRLVFPIIDSNTAQKMLRAIVEIARALDIKLTAEGVETAAHAKLLSEVGCDTLQGYYFAKPMSAADLAEFLRTYDAAAVRASCFHGSGNIMRAG